MFKFILVCAFGFAISGVSKAEIALDKLNDCSGISEATAALERYRMRTPVCRSPAGIVERKVINSISASSGTRACFLKTAPAQMISEFSCLYIAYASPTSQFVCFRDADLVDINDYKAKYPEFYGSKVASYLTKASSCTSNHDSSIAPASLFPLELAQVARYQFGYVSALGKHDKAASRIVHGYALIDPDLLPDGAIEFVAIADNLKPGSERTSASVVGPWLFSADQNDQYVAQANSQLKQAAVHSFIRAESYSIRRPSTGIATSSDKPQLLADWQKAIADQFVQSGFAIMTDKELRANGIDLPQLRDNIENRRPYGEPAGATVHLTPKLIALKAQAGPSCIGSDGAILAVISAQLPHKDAQSDYGGLDYYITALGNCGEDEGEIKVFLDHTERDVLAGFTEGLRQQ